MTEFSSGGDHQQALDRCLARMRIHARRMLSRHPHLRRWEQTSDLVQNAFIRLHNAMKLPELESPRSIVALAVTQLNRELVDAIRRNKIRSRWAKTAKVNPVGESDEEIALEDWARFHEAVEKLPEGQRDAVQSLWYLGLDQKSAADRLGVSVRTLGRYLHDGRESLRMKLPDLVGN